jgi:hypothetical protein
MLDQAKQWLQQNPNDPRAEAVRAKISQMEQQGIDNASERKVLDEAHPAVSWKDRAIVKNFAQGNGLNYLQQKYPNLQVEQDADGNVLLKGKKEKEWRKLDPSSLELADVSDIAFDIGAGIVEGTAAAGGALLGNVPGAMAGAGASAAALETLRQGIGKQLGVNEEYDPTQIGAAGVGSALLTPLAGVGKVAPGLRQKLGNALGRDLTEKGVSELAEKGVLKKGYEQFTRGALPNLAQVTSGEKAKVFKDYVSNLDVMEKWKQDESLFENAVVKAGMDVEAAIEKEIKTAGKEMQAILNTSGADVRINLEETMGEMTDAISKLRTSGFEDNLELANELDTVLKRIFYKKEPKEGVVNLIPRDFVTLEEAREMQKLLRNRSAGYRANLTGDPLKDEKVKFTWTATKKISQAIDEALDFAEEGQGKAFKSARARYRQALGGEAILNKFMKVNPKNGMTDYSKSFDALRQLNNPSKLMFKKAVERVNPDIVKQADLVTAFHRLSDPSFFQTTGTSTSTSRTIAMGTLGAAAGAATNEGGLGGGPGTVAGMTVGLLGLSPRAWKFYLSQGKRGEDFIKQQFRKAGQKVPGNIKNYFNRQMAAQSIWGTMQNEAGQKNDRKK